MYKFAKLPIECGSHEVLVDFLLDVSALAEISRKGRGGEVGDLGADEVHERRGVLV